MFPRPAFSTVLLALLCGTLLSSARAQFYAPDTEYHDRAQRHFVVELCRVLAWRQNQAGAGPKVAEVTYTVSTSPEDHSTHWVLHWLDAEGKPLRESAVGYPAEALTTGQAWYWDVARQLGLAAKQPGNSID